MGILSGAEVEVVVALRTALGSGEARAVREAAGATQAQAARDIGVDAMTVSRWERGKRTPRPRVALRAAPVYARYAELGEST
jgi:transcriptional regulator with XRE-family HTH domain